jgi:hypothetical protein
MVKVKDSRSLRGRSGRNIGAGLDVKSMVKMKAMVKMKSMVKMKAMENNLAVQKSGSKIALKHKIK